MKALKISLLLVAVVVLTVSVISKDSITENVKVEYKSDSKKLDLLAHRKDKVKGPSNS